MSDGKGKLPTDSSPAEIDEGWNELDEAIASAVPPPAPPAAEADVLSLKDRHKTDQDHLAVRPEDLAASEGAAEEWEGAVPTAKHLPRDLPLAPPGERRVAKTIMGVGTPELQAALKARLAAKSAPEPAAPTSPVTRPLTPPAPAKAADPNTTTTRERPPPRGTPTGPRPPSNPTGPARERPAPATAPSQALAETDRVPVVSGSEEVPPRAALASTASLGQPPPPPVPYAQTAPSIEAHTVRMRPGGAPAVTPTAATRRAQPERRAGQGPSNLALILLWTVALISVGLALYLYFARG